VALLRLSTQDLLKLAAREPVYLESSYVSARLDPQSLRALASARRQALFGVTLSISAAAASKKWVSGVLREAEGGQSLSIVVLSGDPGPRQRIWRVSAYTDALPTNIALYLDPGVPDEVGPKALKYRELAAEARRLRRLGARVPPSTSWEMDELNYSIWSAAKRARRLAEQPGAVTAEFPLPSGVGRLRMEVPGPEASLSKAIQALHDSLCWTIKAPADPATARDITEAFIAARAGGYGEARLPAMLEARGWGVGEVKLATPSGKAGRLRGREGWEAPPEGLADAVHSLTGGLFEARRARPIKEGAVLLEGEATLRVRWEPLIARPLLLK
jgi:hypothetical protein